MQGNLNVAEHEQTLSGRYRLDDSVGRGAVAGVWRGFDLQLRRAVAVKVFDRSMAADLPDAHAETRFRREAVAAARLTHQNVAAVYDAGADDGRLYLVMEFLPGGSLADLLLAGGALPVLTAVEYAAQIAEGLAAAHRAGVLHRDVKPANLLLDNEDAVKIVDFGIAEIAGDAASRLTANGQVIGSGAYLAPERALGRATGPAADLYSLGCVLFELLTGSKPFPSNSAAAQAHAHVYQTPVPPSARRPGIPAEIDAVVLGLLAKDPAQRPDDGTIVAARLRSAIDKHQPTAAPGRTAVSRTALDQNTMEHAALDTGALDTGALDTGQLDMDKPETDKLDRETATPGGAHGRRRHRRAGHGSRAAHADPTVAIDPIDPDSHVRVVAVAAVAAVAIAAVITVLIATLATRTPDATQEAAGPGTAASTSTEPTAAASNATPSPVSKTVSPRPSPSTSTSTVELTIPTAVPGSPASTVTGPSVGVLNSLSGWLRVESRAGRLSDDAARSAMNDLERSAQMVRRDQQEQATELAENALRTLDGAQRRGWRPMTETQQLIDELRSTLP